MQTYRWAVQMGSQNDLGKVGLIENGLKELPEGCWCWGPSSGTLGQWRTHCPYSSRCQKFAVDLKEALMG